MKTYKIEKSFGQSLGFHNKGSQTGKTPGTETKSEKEAIWYSHIANHHTEDTLWQ